MMENGSFGVGATCFPSTTGPAYLPYLTGVNPCKHDITGIRWFDKEVYKDKGRWNRNSMRSYCGYEAKYFNDDMDEQYPSILEEYDAFNIYNMITKGVRPERDVTASKKTKLYFRAHFKHAHHPVDEYGHDCLMDVLDQDPQFIFAVFPSIDWDSHTYHYESDHTLASYKIVDKSLGEVTQKLKEKGWEKDTLIFMGSDHGLSSTHSHLDIGSFFKKNKYRVIEYPNILSIAPQVAVTVSGNSFCTVAFLDQKERYAFDPIIKKHGTVLHHLVAEDAIDFILIDSGEKDKVIVYSDHGQAEVSRLDEKYYYKNIKGNVLGLDIPEAGWTRQESLDYTVTSDYPDALYQIIELFRSQRSADVVISAATGYDLRDFWEIPEHKGSHGSLHWEHMRVPLLFNKPDMVDGTLSTTDIHTILKEWLSA